MENKEEIEARNKRDYAIYKLALESIYERVKVELTPKQRLFFQRQRKLLRTEFKEAQK